MKWTCNYCGDKHEGLADKSYNIIPELLDKRIWRNARDYIYNHRLHNCRHENAFVDDLLSLKEDPCFECHLNLFRLALSNKDTPEAYAYFENLLNQNHLYKTVNKENLRKFLDDSMLIYKNKIYKLSIQENINTLLSLKKHEIVNEYGYSWVFPKLDEHNHMCAMRYNENLVMVENNEVEIVFPEKTEELCQVETKLKATSASDLYMISIIPCKNIVSFQLVGDVEHTAMISGGGNYKPNYTGAAVGGLLFGAAGAIIGSQAGVCMNPIKSEVIEFDSRRTLLNLKNAEGQVEIKELPYYYSEVFMKVIPEKEFNFIQANKNAEQTTQIPQASKLNMVEEMKQLKELLDLNLITQEEFDSKRQQILK